MSVNYVARQSKVVWEVYCNNCLETIGTMTGETLQQAIDWALDRGGIKCPTCRETACKGCGVQLREEQTDYCTICSLEYMAAIVSLECLSSSPYFHGDSGDGGQNGETV